MLELKSVGMSHDGQVSLTFNGVSIVMSAAEAEFLRIALNDNAEIQKQRKHEKNWQHMRDCVNSCAYQEPRRRRRGRR